MKSIRILNFLFTLIFLSVLLYCSKEIIDTENPTISIISPQSMSIVSDSVYVKCNASDNSGIKWLELWINGKPVSRIEDEPFQFTVYASQYENDSQINVKVLACDRHENEQ